MTRGLFLWKPHAAYRMMILLLTLVCQSSHSFRHRQHAATPADDGEALRVSSKVGGLPTTPVSSSSTGVFPVSPTPTSAAASGASPPPPPLDVVVRLHQQAQLECTLEAAADRQLSWRHGESPLGEHVTQRYSRDRGHLTIVNVRLEDAGLWTCEDERGNNGHVINLIVTEPPRSPYLEVDGRRLDPGNVFLPVTEGTSLSVWCSVEGGFPPPSITWSMAGAATHTPPLLSAHDTLNATHRGDPLQHVRSEATLTRVLRAHHNATVTCHVHHVTLDYPLNATLLLDVQYVPSFAISRVPGFGFPILEGIPVSLKCDVDSNPPSSPLWLRDDGPPPVPQSVDGFLNFSAIRREHSGWYKCTSREFSSIGYFLNVRYEDPPSVTESTGEPSSTGRHVEVALGGALQLHCPESSWSCWSRVGAGGGLEPVAPGPELSLDRVLYQEAGHYRCTAGEAHPRMGEWRALLAVDVTVTGAPAVYPANQTVTAAHGQSLSLTVEFCANPEVNRALWITDRDLLRPGDITSTLVAHNVTAGSSPHCQMATLTVRAVTPPLAGEYVFLVRSPKGLAEGSIMVNVTRASGFSVGVTAEGTAAALCTTLLLMLAALLVSTQSCQLY